MPASKPGFLGVRVPPPVPSSLEESRTMTHSYAILEVSQQAYDEVRQKLEAAGWRHAFHENGLIDMHDVAIQREIVRPVKHDGDGPHPYRRCGGL